ncbi:hypothetical protein PAUR_a0347 [Pseudoalteromonas aurantia 208]|uniref:Uncharacterized protein n=2 Tax=Pseudoalteromonas aurantia TaxID=43654 RepID=A0ABR9E7R2_9GAMM|nr:hypothetical protein [Pseudoalteromonas aurantia 208]
MYKADQFEMISNVLPLNWVVSYDADSYFELAPKSWITPGFWEAYFDGEPEAIQLFNTEKNIIFKQNT